MYAYVLCVHGGGATYNPWPRRTNTQPSRHSGAAGVPNVLPT